MAGTAQFVVVALLATSLISCGDSRPAKRPEEVPIAEFKPGEPGPAMPTLGGTSDPSTGDVGKGGPPPKDISIVTKPDPAAKDDPSKAAAKGIDAIDGFLGMKFGANSKGLSRARVLEKGGDRVVYMVTDRRKYGSVVVTGALYSFVKGKMATVAFRVKAAKDCQKMKASLEQDLGAATATASSPSESYVWKGDNVGIRWGMDTKGCSGLVVSKTYARDNDWNSLEP